jgi:hypothetical protein
LLRSLKMVEVVENGFPIFSDWFQAIWCINVRKSWFFEILAVSDGTLNWKIAISFP